MKKILEKYNLPGIILLIAITTATIWWCYAAISMMQNKAALERAVVNELNASRVSLLALSPEIAQEITSQEMKQLQDIIFTIVRRINGEQVVTPTNDTPRMATTVLLSVSSELASKMKPIEKKQLQDIVANVLRRENQTRTNSE